MLQRQLTFDQFNTQYSIPITINEDGILEGMEDFILHLESLSGALIVTDGQSAVEISDGTGNL